MEYVGFALFGLLFLWSGIFNHIKQHSQLSGYAASGFGDCPFAVQLGYLGGWPTGVYLVIVGVLSACGMAVGFYGAAVFLLLTTALYHRSLTDPHTYKNIALLGAALSLGVLA